MPNINFKATKMTGAQVSHISLVERGANRIPFKVVKQEKDMSAFQGLDLGGLFSRRKSEKKDEPMVVAVVTMKGESLDSVKKQVEDAGFTVADMHEMEDGSVVFKQGEVDLDEAMADSVVVRLNDHIALVTKGFSPYNMDVTADGVSFADQCAAKGFYPGVNSIMETLSDAVRSVVYSAKTPAEAKAGVTKLFSEASAYTAAFVGGLPQKAFKLEKMDLPNGDGVSGDDAAAAEAVAKAAKATGLKCPECGADVAKGDTACPKCGADLTKTPPVKKADGDADGEGSASGEGDSEVTCKACGGKKKKTDMAQKADGSEDEVCKACKNKGTTGQDGDGMDGEGTAADDTQDGKGKKAKKAGDSLTAEDVSSIVASQVESMVTKAMGDVMGKLEGFATTFQTIQKSVEDMKGGLESVSSRVEQAEVVAKAAKEAVAGTVVGGSESGDHAPAAAKKSEKSGFGGEIDTAFMPRVRKANR